MTNVVCDKVIKVKKRNYNNFQYHKNKNLRPTKVKSIIISHFTLTLNGKTVGQNTDVGFTVELYDPHYNSGSIIKNMYKERKPQNVRGMACALGKQQPPYKQQGDKSSHKTSEATFRGNCNTKTFATILPERGQ